MFRSQYDSDITTWSPDGRIHQIEYAMEAVKLGSACVGLKSKEFAIVAAVMRSPDELASHQKKVFQIDEHVGISIAGLTADARGLTRFLRGECSNHRWMFESNVPVSRLATRLADKAQVHTQRAGRRPYGVGLLIAGYDVNGPHVYEFCPSGNFFDYKAQSIGARSQSCKTYLEKNYDQFADSSKEELIQHALTSLREALGTEKEDGLTRKSVSLGVVGKDTRFTILSEEEIQTHLDVLKAKDEGEEPAAEAAAPAAEGDGDATMAE